MYKVLIVEDEPVMRKGLIRLLALDKHGYTLCGEAENGEEALELIDRHRPHVVVTDIKMPLMDGLELIRQVKESGRTEPRFIILSGYHEFEYARTAIRYGVVDYLLKPVDEVELIGLLERIADELGREARKRFKEAAVHALIGQGEAGDGGAGADLPDSVWQGPYRYVAISLNEAVVRQHRSRICAALDAASRAGMAVAVPAENGTDVGLVLAGKALREIGDDWGALADRLAAGLSGCGDAAALSSLCFIIGEQVEQLQAIRASYRTALMSGAEAVQSGGRFYVCNRSGSWNSASLIGEMEQLIRERYREPITLKEMAKVNYMHPIYLGKLFKKTTGMHFKDYLHKVRIEEAKLLLRSSDLKVYEIADYVGYTDQDYFMDKFKKWTGMTPTQYRETI